MFWQFSALCCNNRNLHTYKSSGGFFTARQNTTIITIFPPHYTHLPRKKEIRRLGKLSRRSDGLVSVPQEVGLIPLFRIRRAKTAIIKNTVRLLYESKYRVQLRHNAGAAQGEAERGPETCLKLHG